MRSSSFRIALTLAVSLQTAAAWAGQSWQGARVMPKSDQFQLQVEGRVTGDVYQVAWPATVEKTEGRWLWIRDEGGYSSPGAAGWVYADDVLKLDDAREFYSNQLQTAPTAFVFWLRELQSAYWESQRELGVALNDYNQALELGLDNRLDDVRIRLGRLTSQSVLESGHGKFDETEKKKWEDHFDAAQAMYRAIHGPQADRPQLHLEWGNALSTACQCSQNRANGIEPKRAPPAAKAPAVDAKNPDSGTKGTETVAKPPAAGAAPSLVETLRTQAADQFVQAEKFNPHWWRVPFARAELLLDRCGRESDIGRIEPKPDAAADSLREAAAYFSVAISLNPNSPDAYRDRGEALRLAFEVSHPSAPGTTPEGAKRVRQGALELVEAKQSISKACQMTYNRQSSSLRAMAEVCGAMTDYENALKFATRASEYCPEENRGKMKGLQNEYAADLQEDKGTTGLANTVHQVYVASSKGGETTRGGPAETEIYSIPQSLGAYEESP